MLLGSINQFFSSWKYESLPKKDDDYVSNQFDKWMSSCSIKPSQSAEDLKPILKNLHKLLELSLGKDQVNKIESKLQEIASQRQAYKNAILKEFRKHHSTIYDDLHNAINFTCPLRA